MKTRPKNSRPTIGLLIETTAGTGEYQTVVWNGVVDAAQERDANLICFAGGALERSPSNEFERQRNVLHHLAIKSHIDGAIISGTLGIYAPPDEFRHLYERIHPRPVVGIAKAFPGIPSLLVDNYRGTRAAIGHLVETHGCRRIAFIRGPEGNVEAQERYRAYTDTLADYGLPFDPDLVTTGDFGRQSGAEAMRVLLDRHGAGFEAVAAANDDMALGALEVLKAKGIHVPRDVAIVGFDDVEASRAATPPLTTVRQPMHELGRQAVESLLALLAGQEVPEQVMLLTELVIRRSCGCLTQGILQVAPTPVRATKLSSPNAFLTQRDFILSAVEQAIHPSGIARAEVEQLLDSFAAAIQERSPAIFLNALDDVLREAAESGDVTVWHEALSALRSHTLPHLNRAETLDRAEDLWQQARIMIGDAAQRVQAHRRLQARLQAEILREIGQALITTFDLTELMNVIARELPRVGIESCYLSLYEDKRMPPEWSRLIMAYDRGRRIELEDGGRRFPSHQLVPQGMLPVSRQYSMVAVPLYFQEEQIGLVLFEVGPREGSIYETLRGQLSSALKGARLLRSERRALLLQTAAEVSHAANSVLDADELIHQVVNLARERFDLYYAGLFLVDQTGEWTGEPGRWAVLRAGTGEAGQKMLEQGHKLEIGGVSMIGWCIANKQARVALDVGAEAIRFDNPLLPATRSELALPLVSRGEVIGALTIQSTQEAAFSNEDIAVLQTMADQLANAITNARLYEQAQRELAERKRAEAALARQAQELTESLEQFARVAAHDLQEPLRMVASYAQLLAQRYRGRLDPEADEFIGYAVEGATRMHRLINDLLTYWQVGTRVLTIKSVDCSTVVNRILANLDGAIQASGATVTCDPMPTVMADATQLMQVFQHLLVNAIRFRSERPLQIRIGATRQDGGWRFSVSDNGIGIEPQYFERIFTLFQPLQRQKEHSGIGLAVCKKIVERHGGRIWVESEPGQGSTFHFTIPDRKETHRA